MVYVGIDVASEKHDCCILGSCGDVLSEFTFSNNRNGFNQLLVAVSGHCAELNFENARVGLESTGHFSTNITNFLLAKHLSMVFFSIKNFY